ncbi:hypothetical protein LIER_27770 [Lithospermum erythrorhizon]|uniref:SWIM-type domain-containing protein n=1 Tax=Lithospermum erythrorhizon TaxID=34254 RepID=A0AAV3RDB3_LITER
MTRLVDEQEKKMKIKGVVGPNVSKVLREREKHIHEYITRPSGSPRYEVTSAKHSFVVDVEKKICSCGLWQLGGIPCVHVVCVYRSHNKNPRKYVHPILTKPTLLTVYSHFLESLRGPTFWTKSPYPDILPPELRVLPRKPKRCRQKDEI